MNRRNFLTTAGGAGLAALVSSCAPGLYQATSRNSKYNTGSRKGLAVIVNHAEEDHHMDNVLRSYNFFRWIGFNENDIKVLSVPYANYQDEENIEKVAKGKKAETGGDLTSIVYNVMHKYPVLTVPRIIGPPTSKNLRYLLDGAKKLDSNSEFFLYITGHGYYNEKKKTSNILTLGSSGDPEDLIVWNPKGFNYHFKHLKTKGNVMIVDGCRTGGFSELANKNTTIVTRTDEETEDLCEAFAEGLFNSLRWRDQYFYFGEEKGIKITDKRFVTLNDSFNRMKWYHEMFSRDKFTGSITGEYNPVLIDKMNSRFVLPKDIVQVMRPLPSMGGVQIYIVPTESHCEMKASREKFEFGNLPDKVYMVRKR